VQLHWRLPNSAKFDQKFVRSRIWEKWPNFIFAEAEIQCNPRDDGKCPDGSTLIPWLAGRWLAWDVTVVNTLAQSYISISTSPGSAAEHAAARKSAIYSSLPNPTFSSCWLWRPSVPSAQPASHSLLSRATD